MASMISWNIKRLVAGLCLSLSAITVHSDVEYLANNFHLNLYSTSINVRYDSEFQLEHALKEIVALAGEKNYSDVLLPKFSGVSPTGLLKVLTKLNHHRCRFHIINDSRGVIKSIREARDELKPENDQELYRAHWADPDAVLVAFYAHALKSPEHSEKIAIFYPLDSILYVKTTEIVKNLDTEEPASFNFKDLLNTEEDLDREAKILQRAQLTLEEKLAFRLAENPHRDNWPRIYMGKTGSTVMKGKLIARKYLQYIPNSNAPNYIIAWDTLGKILDLLRFPKQFNGKDVFTTIMQDIPGMTPLEQYRAFVSMATQKSLMPRCDCAWFKDTATGLRLIEASRSPSGATYEFEHINHWIQHRGIDPLTGVTLEKDDLQSNEFIQSRLKEINEPHSIENMGDRFEHAMIHRASDPTKDLSLESYLSNLAYFLESTLPQEKNIFTRKGMQQALNELKPAKSPQENTTY